MKKTIKEAIFVYLAITKAIYWNNTIIGIRQSDLEGAGEAVLQRLLGQDLLIIIGIVIFFSLDKLIVLKKKNSKHSKVLEYSLFYGIGYVALMVAWLAYFWVVVRLSGESLEMNWPAFLVNYTVGFVVLAAFLEFKFYLKDKEKKTLGQMQERTIEDQLAMLKALRDDGVLTPNEYNNKREAVLRVDIYANK